jgi:outer membrane biosynthesis protein TonB
MKTSSLLTSLLFGAVAIAAPVQKRALVTKTSTVVETQIVFVTVWDGQIPVAAPTTTPGLFYEQPAHKASSTAAVTTPSAAAYTPPKQEEKPSSTSPSSAPSTPAPEPTPEYTPEPEPTPEPKPEEPKPEPTPEYTPEPKPAPQPTPSPAPVEEEPAPVYTPAPAPEAPATKPVGGGNEYHGEVTVYDTYNTAGACGRTLSDAKFTAAVAESTWGPSVWVDNLDTNPWCGKMATVTYKGKSITVEIQDKCMDCKPGDIDITRAAWQELTGGLGGAAGDRVPVSWTT